MPWPADWDIIRRLAASPCPVGIWRTESRTGETWPIWASCILSMTWAASWRRVGESTVVGSCKGVLRGKTTTLPRMGCCLILGLVERCPVGFELRACMLAGAVRGRCARASDLDVSPNPLSRGLKDRPYVAVPRCARARGGSRPLRAVTSLQGELQVNNLGRSI